MHFSSLFKFCPVCGSENFKMNNDKSKICKQCGFVYFVNPSAAVAAFIVNANNELLLCRRAHEPHKGSLDLAGGFVDVNETGEQAIEREIKEELNSQTTIIKYLFSLPNDYEYSKLNIPTLDLFYLCELEDYKNIQPADDVSECFFVPIDKIDPHSFGLSSIKTAVEIFQKTFIIN
jgi:ADP-ribose pyrophosphatase YjhB (NUDIX family)